MAELVHLRLEHTLPELEEMERVGLFSKDEIRKIVKKRKAFEYKLRRSSKRKEDFLKYIEYEMSLLSLISKRRERLLCESKKQEIDNKVAKRISRLFKAAISRFPDDQKLLLDQIQFCKKMKWYDNVSQLNTHMLRIHSRNPAVWIIAAKWEMEEMRSPENARQIFLRGVQINPDSKILWREYFRMELMYIDLIQKRKEVLQLQKIEDPDSVKNDAILGGKILMVVFDEAIKAIDDDVEFALSFTQICMDFSFAYEHIIYILNEVKRLFPKKEETLDALAKQSLLNIEEKIKEGREKGVKKKAVIEKINEDIFSHYEEAVKELPTEKMWSFFIDFILTLIKSSKENKKGFLQERLIEVMERAASFGCLSTQYYSEWIDLLFEKGEENDALSLSLEAARKWNRVDLWFKTLTLHIQCNQPSKQIYEYLMEAVNSVPEKDSIILWKLGIDMFSVFDTEKLTELFEMGIKKRKEVSAPLQEMYLEATALRSGIESTRNLYKKLKKLGPLSPNISRKMIMLEMSQLNPSIAWLRQYYEDGISEFGATNIDIWLDYMKLEKEHIDGNSANYSTILWRAKKTLQAEYLADFLTHLTESTMDSNH